MKLALPTLIVAGLAGLSARSPGRASVAAPAAETYSVDPVHSSVLFHTKHMGISEAYGRFNTVSGDKSRLVYDAADAGKSSILLVLDAASIDTANPQRDQHLKSPDFFSAKEHPEIVFESQAVSGKGDELEVAGELTLGGVKKPVRARARRVGQGEVAMFQDYRAGFLAEFTIDMREFGIDFVEKNPGAVGPEVHVTVSLECVRQ